MPQSLSASNIQLRVVLPNRFNVPARSLTPAELAGAEIQSRLPDGGTFSGVVTRADGQPQAGAKILLHSSSTDDRLVGATTDSNGAFSLRLSPNAQDHEILVQGPDFAPKIVKVQPDIKPAAITVKPGRTVEIRVVNTQNAPIPDALIEGTTENGVALDGSIFTDQQGRARWLHAPESGLQFRTSRNGFTVVYDVLEASKTNIRIQLTPTRMLSGSVVDTSTGQPIPYFKILAEKLPADDGRETYPPQAVGIGRRGEFQLTSDGSNGKIDLYRIEAPGYKSSGLIRSKQLEAKAPYRIQLEPL